MKIHLKISSYFILTLLLLTFSCSSDDDSDLGESSSINAKNLIIDFDENPTAGTNVGTIQAISNSTLSYSITSQTPSGALSINPSTGELKVANATLFDFETNPIINATISITNDQSSTTATATATINLNNLDDIEFLLTNSKAAYIAAENNNWISITEDEYQLLSEQLNLVSPLGTNYEDYLTNGNYGRYNATVTNGAGSPNLPNGNYFFAFKYHSISNNVVGARVKISATTQLTGYIDWGRELPEHGIGDNFFVLKNDLAVPVGTTAYVAFFTPGWIGIRSTSSSKTCYSADGDVFTMPETSITSGYVHLYQGLYTSQKQWGN